MEVIRQGGQSQAKLDDEPRSIRTLELAYEHAGATGWETHRPQGVGDGHSRRKPTVGYTGLRGVAAEALLCPRVGDTTGISWPAHPLGVGELRHGRPSDNSAARARG